MKYYLVEQFENGEHTAWDKARADAEIIAEKSGFQPMCISALNENRSRESKIKKLFDHFKIKRHWKKTFKTMQKGDELLIQIPVINNCINF